MADDAYDTDFVVWADEQAAALRARGAGGNALDYDRLAEEIEDLGKAVRNKARSYVRRIIEHLFKIESTRQTDPSGHWRIEIENFRLDAGDELTPVVRRELTEQLDQVHRQAWKLARASFDVHEPNVPIDAERRWTLEEILGEADDPIMAPPPPA